MSFLFKTFEMFECIAEKLIENHIFCTLFSDMETGQGQGERQKLNKMLEELIKEEQEQNSELQRSDKNWEEEVKQLKKVVADKEKELSMAIKRQRMRTVGFVDDLSQLGSTKPELGTGKEYAPLKAESGQELDEVQVKLSDMEENLKTDISGEQLNCWQEIPNEENFRKQLPEQKRKINEELRLKEEQLRQQLSVNEESFKQKLSEELMKFNQELAEQDEAIRRQLLHKDLTLQKMLTEVCQQWEARAQQWSERQKQMEEMLEQKEKAREEEEVTYKQETQRLQEELRKLQDASAEEKKKQHKVLEKLRKEAEDHRRELKEVVLIRSELQRIATNYQEVVHQLRKGLADKDVELTTAIAKYQMKTFAYSNTLHQLKSTRADVYEASREYTALKEEHLKLLEELQESHQRQLFDMEDKFKKEISEEHEKCFQKKSSIEKYFRKELMEEERKFNQELRLKEEQIKLELLKNEESQEDVDCSLSTAGGESATVA